MVNHCPGWSRDLITKGALASRSEWANLDVCLPSAGLSRDMAKASLSQRRHDPFLVRLREIRVHRNAKDPGRERLALPQPGGRPGIVLVGKLMMEAPRIVDRARDALALEIRTKLVATSALYGELSPGRPKALWDGGNDQVGALQG